MAAVKSVPARIGIYAAAIVVAICSTEHLAILSYRHAFNLFDIGGGAAIATISFAILSIAVFFYFRVFPLEDE